MANICGDDVYFFSSTNPDGLLSLWEDLEASIVICPDADKAWIGNLFEYKGIDTTDIYEAKSLEALKVILEDSDIYIHEFKNPYQPDHAAA